MCGIVTVPLLVEVEVDGDSIYDEASAVQAANEILADRLRGLEWWPMDCLRISESDLSTHWHETFTS